MRKSKKSADAAARFETEPAEGPLLQVVDLHTHFHTGRGVARAVDGVTLSLERGQTLGVVGESGSGKTVLARSIMGLLPKSNVERTGSILFEGREIIDASNDELRALWGSQMSMVFQDPMTSLNPVMKIGNQITEMILQHLDVSKKYAGELALAQLKAVGIPEAERRLKEYPHQMSGGMRQRIMIAIAIACGPKLLFADEPTTALDVTVQAQILDLLEEQQRERFMAMILVTHDLGVVAGRADEIVVMYAGRIVEKAPTGLLFSDMRHPYTEALLRSIPKLSAPSHSLLQAIGGRPPDIVNPPTGCKFSPRCPYVHEKCTQEEPPLVDATSPDHQFRCWTPVGTPENRAALEANRAAGLESALAVVEDVLPAGVSTATETLPQVTTSHLRGGTINPKGSV
ncbi:MAG: ABC transporter ATP-binding protein [Acidimicrobiia bacterium]|nr:ABC transporter ATP-binding protein [Acidimicrobiia bacterium]